MGVMEFLIKAPDQLQWTISANSRFYKYVEQKLEILVQLILYK